MNGRRPTCEARVECILSLNDDTFIVRITGATFVFNPGQHVRIGLPGHDLREYSIYSSPGDPVLEILVRKVEGGGVSHELHDCVPGDALNVEGPFGQFVLSPEWQTQRFLFIANGTGIAPFRSMLKAHPALNAQVLHGVRRNVDLCIDPAVAAHPYVGCVSRESGGDWQGRLTSYLLQMSPLEPGTQCYLCGSCDMIYEVFAILESRGIPRDDIHVETYY